METKKIYVKIELNDLVELKKQSEMFALIGDKYYKYKEFIRKISQIEHFDKENIEKIKKEVEELKNN